MNFDNFDIKTLFADQNIKTDARIFLYEKILKKIYFLATYETKKKGNRQMFFTFQKKHAGLPLISDPQACKIFCCQALTNKGFQVFSVTPNTVRIMWTHIDRTFQYKQNLRHEDPTASRVAGNMNKYYAKINKKFSQ